MPNALGRNVYLVLDDFGGTFAGWDWPETDVATPTALRLSTACSNQYSSPFRVVRSVLLNSVVSPEE